ncbi:hypothetical protein [Microbaculum sp. FT89]
MTKRTRNWILIVVATAIILAVGYSSRWDEEAAVLDEAGSPQTTR